MKKNRSFLVGLMLSILKCNLDVIKKNETLRKQLMKMILKRLTTEFSPHPFSKS
jgi:hypothetical protein